MWGRIVQTLEVAHYAYAKGPCRPRINAATFSFNKVASYVALLTALCKTILLMSVGNSCQILRLAAPRQAITRRSPSSSTAGSNTSADLGNCKPPSLSQRSMSELSR